MDSYNHGYGAEEKLIRYRADIDGLRAIAVWMVILYHYWGEDRFNGYMGVDIFFVISGYLITKIIYRDIQDNKFSLINFYERRARRILPALSAILLFSTIVAYILFLPTERTPFAESLIYTSLFSSNFLFWMEAGYFDMSAFVKPLLHTWSLAIEEQFYILFPLILVGLRKFTIKNVQIIILVICLLSFVTNIALILSGYQNTAFYMLPARAWELMVGALIALNIVRIPQSEFVFKLCSWGGVALILAGVLKYVYLDQFPGIYALPPVLGAGLLIYAGQYHKATLVQSFLSHKYAVFMGKISYSLYLWHWPLYVFVSYYWVSDIGAECLIGMMILCTTLAYLSVRFVELPFRRGNFVKKTSRAFILSFISIGVFIAVGSAVFIPSILAEKIEIAEQKKEFYRQVMVDKYNEKVFAFGVTAVPSNAQVALWGDSHAAALHHGIYDLAVESKKTVILLEKNDFLVPSNMCDPISHEKECQYKTDNQLQYLIDHPTVKTVVLSMRWSAWVRGWQKKASNPEDALLLRYTSLEKIVKKLEAQDKKIIIWAQVPEITSIPNNQKIKSIVHRIESSGRNIDLRPSVQEYLKDTKDIIPLLKRLENNTSAKIIWPHEYLCDETYCKMRNGDDIFYSDDDHLSLEGVRYILPLFSTVFNSSS